MAAPRWLPAAALMLNAFTWGVSWWPFRQLQDLGLHPLWATVLIYAVAVLAITLWRPSAWRDLATTRTLWLLVLASGTTNATFNWGVTMGDVVRVVLLFYLMPLWAVLLARWLLHEPLTRAAALRVALALVGAGTVLWPPGGGWPLPHSLAEWLGVLGGFTFALNNVMLRREAHRPEAARALAMFLGGAVVSACIALALSPDLSPGLAPGLSLGLSQQGGVPLPPALAPAWVLGALAMGALFLMGNAALQYGAARLPANITAVVMVSEVLFASVSAVLLGAGTVTPQLAMGGLLIVLASVLASRE